MKMNWLRQNWDWLVIVLIGVFPLAGIIKMINIDFSGTGTSWITMDSVAFQGRGHEGPLKIETGAHMAVKETRE